MREQTDNRPDLSSDEKWKLEFARLATAMSELRKTLAISDPVAVEPTTESQEEMWDEVYTTIVTRDPNEVGLRYAFGELQSRFILTRRVSSVGGE